ncbi:hypothetical protein [Domibacillus aminovorans]|uniref:Uncharacterized protein n=1 Tax=Domibacillus aminovorans TaxID=29332 RepID=A0A177L8Z3_9BACI|nr:hypothetical protein [Domibacillus aminovorans]OAH61944.1 hypothetical protein AWH49_11005 [Domibacillus aminovorans]
MADQIARVLAKQAADQVNSLDQKMESVYDLVYTPPGAILALNPNVSVKEYGDLIDSILLTGTITRNLMDVTKVEFYRGAALLQAVNNPSAQGGTFTYTENTDVADTVTFKVKAYDEKGSAEASKTITYVYPMYAGSEAAASPTAAQVKALTKLVKTKSNTAHAFTLSDSRFVFAYPQSYGLLTSITDANGFETIGAYTRTTVTITGLDGIAVPYYVYTLNNPTSQTKFTNTFKF